MTQEQHEILIQFRLDGEPTGCEPFGCGHINRTYLVTTESGSRYILQKINSFAFKNVAGLMYNIEAVTDYLRQRVTDPRAVLTLVKTADGAAYIRHGDEYWRVVVYVPDSLCLQKPETAADFYESAVAFGTFQQLLEAFPAETLNETIPNFHNTPDRYAIFHRALAADRCGRAKDCAYETDEYLRREEQAGVLAQMLKRGELPLRVTHNDTKLNNVLFDAKTRKALCVIDLDTVMPGLMAYDYGDAIRYGAATHAEDEKDLSRVSLDMELFRAFTGGFLRACPGIMRAELESLPLGAKTITLECGLRFLTDYLDGDRYFATDYPEHNLVRSRAQLRMLQDMESKWQQMLDIVEEESGIKI